MKRFSKLLLLGGGISGVGYGVYRTAKTPDGGFDVYNIGAARFGRAAVTVTLFIPLDTINKIPAKYRLNQEKAMQASAFVFGPSGSSVQHSKYGIEQKRTNTSRSEAFILAFHFLEKVGLNTHQWASYHLRGQYCHFRPNREFCFSCNLTRIISSSWMTGSLYRDLAFRFSKVQKVQRGVRLI